MAEEKGSKQNNQGTDVKRIIIAGSAPVAAVPASLGLIGGASFAQSAPVGAD